ncbi:DNA polymerase III subunits gamma and tau [hydrothermal vent metagenome]|uniref:DNA-directed DNA polymerase n=1 Tax=hydrothermal vent metagenome TaxID=652676 RepID=A0A3B0VJD3_9ZZZZ
MSYQSLYRTYRPKTFAEVEGQPQVTRPLAEQISSKKIGHAYLFSGSRGLGKTSVARILAREIGCTEKDLYEIDAASNNSVDDIRALSEGVYTMPFESPYKVYILDEVHMLSKSAWNAFLKTLEEPPEYVVFVLATTEIEKVPDTVQSRCQVFDFKKPTRAVLASVVSGVAKKEGYEIERGASELVAMLADGSYRDALSVLQRVLTTAHGKSLSRDVVEETTGAPKREFVHAIVSAISGGSRKDALTVLERVRKSGADISLFLVLLIEALRNTLLLRYAPELRDTILEEIGSDEGDILLEYAKDSSASRVTHSTLLAFLNASDRIRFSPIPVLPLELAILEIFPDV